MDYLEDNKIKDFVKNAIIEKLELHKENTFYACDLGYMLFEEDNISGTYHYSTTAAKKWIIKYFEDLDEIVEEISFNFDEDFCKKLIVDIFHNPERFAVVIILEVANYILSQCKTIEEKWDNEITLDDEIIKKLKKELKEV